MNSKKNLKITLKTCSSRNAKYFLLALQFKKHKYYSSWRKPSYPKKEAGWCELREPQESTKRTAFNNSNRMFTTYRRVQLYPQQKFHIDVTHHKALCNQLSISSLNRTLTKTNAYTFFFSLTANFYALVLPFLSCSVLTDVDNCCFLNSMFKGMLDFLLWLQFPSLGGSFKPC